MANVLADGGVLDPIDVRWSEKNSVSTARYPSTPSANAVTAAIRKRREPTIPARCFGSDDGGISLIADCSGRRGVFDDASLTRTRLASQEQQATCFQLVEECCARHSFEFAQRGQVIVMMNWNSSSRGSIPAPAGSGTLARKSNHSTLAQNSESATLPSRPKNRRFRLALCKEVNMLRADVYWGLNRVIVTGS